MALKIHLPPEDEQPSRHLHDKQFSLRMLFVISTLLALIVAGFTRVGFQGAVGMLFGAWVAAIGGYLLLAARRNPKQQFIAIVAGVGTLMVGLAFVMAIAASDKTESTDYLRMFEFNPIIVLAVGFVCYVIWDIKRIKWNISFVVTPDGIIHEKGIPKQKLVAVQEFFRKLEFDKSKLTVRAKRDKQGNLIIRCAGDVTRAEHQRIRNFLVDIL